MRKRKLGIPLALITVAFVADGGVTAQQASASSEIRNADAQRFVSVRLEIHARDTALVIPICGGDEEIHALCAGAAFLQVSTSHGGWRPARVRKGLLATLGMMPKDTWKVRRIDVGDTAYFEFAFSLDLLDVESGKQLRVIVDSWTSEAAMRTKNDPDKRLTSPVVDCP
jgi:hypothetical protein